MIGIIGKTVQKRRSFPIKFRHKVVDRELFFRQAGQIGAEEKRSDRTGIPFKAGVDAAGMLAYRLDGMRFIQAEHRLLIAENGGGEFLFGVAFVNAAQQAVKAAVVFVKDFTPCHEEPLPPQK